MRKGIFYILFSHRTLLALPGWLDKPRSAHNHSNEMSTNQSYETLGSIISETQKTFSDYPEKALATFSSSSEQIDGLRSIAKLRDHEVTVDEPHALGGEDTGPNPVELILAAFGTCQEITYRAYATALGIPLEKVSVHVDGDIDLRGFFAVDDSVRAGYSKIKTKVTLESSAGREDTDKLRAIVEAHCPVLDILSNPVPIEVVLEVREPVEEYS